MITQLHNRIKLLTQRWCTTSCSSMSGNYCLVWFTLMQPGCERGIIVVLNAVEADRIHFLTCQGQR